jgi:uncharacterized membrane protein
MDAILLVLRVLHILAGVFWAGAAFMMAGFVQPAVQAAGPEGGKFMQALVQRSRFSVVMAVAAFVTVLCGILLFGPVSGGSPGSWLSSGRGASIGIGSLAGLAAFVVGFAIQSRASMRMAALGKEIQAAGGKPTPGQAAAMQSAQATISRGGQIGAVLLVICVLGMAAARYL